MSSKLKEIDHGLKDLLARLESMDGLEARVGIQGTKASQQHPGSTLTIAQIAAVHEYGAPVKRGGETVGQIPARPFVRPVVDADPNYWRMRLRAGAREVIKQGANPVAVLRRVAEEIRAKMIERINSGIPPPLAQSTIDRKGEDTPLVDTGTMRSAITAVVGKRGGT